MQRNNRCDPSSLSLFYNFTSDSSHLTFRYASQEPGPLRRFLNVGGANKTIPVPSIFDDFEHVLLDIDPKGNPDIVCDARNLHSLPSGQFDAVYCSHNLEHYFRHDVRKVLSGFLHVLQEGGFVLIRVPDVLEIMRITLERGLDLDEILYVSNAGPISVVDAFYGFSPYMERTGEDFYAHKTGFSLKSLTSALLNAGFSITYSKAEQMEVCSAAFKGIPNPEFQALLKIADGNKQSPT